MKSEVESVGLQELSGLGATTGPTLIKEADLSVVGHVKAKVNVLVGSAEISLNELYSLKLGSIVKLNEKTDALVSLVVEDKIIARGNLVVVGDNFGFEVVEVLP